ncbi:hypothetical protein EV702DRAFT_1047736 [Suillus placidus]|uniref:Uncharacterized protein n=1 Tax=Suillus placidus TaxID=48579 RepID=A0A9P6ZQC2_9AGAM|nr:hypothetical protein EV702DRAFT_1047736 [Suillus placidus]
MRYAGWEQDYLGYEIRFKNMFKLSGGTIDPLVAQCHIPNAAATAMTLAMHPTVLAIDPAADDSFDGLGSLPDGLCDSGDCTPRAGHLGYGRASTPDVERALKLAETFEEERYQQLKWDVDGWNAWVEDDAKVLPILKRKRSCSDNKLGDIEATPCRFGRNVTNSPGRVASVPSMDPTTPKKCRRLQAPFESNPCVKSQSKTLVEALFSIETALERHTAIFSRMCQAMENLT